MLRRAASLVGAPERLKNRGDQVPGRCCTIVAAVAAACAVTLGAGAAVCAENIRQVLTIDIQILPDFTVIETTHEETTPLAQTAVSGAAMARWSVSGNQTVEIVEAFTRKADGRKVPTDRKDFVTQAGAVSASMSFVDLKVQQVPFRDLGVGDTAVLTKKVTEKGHYIPKLYSREIVATSGPFRRSFEVTLRTPASLDIRHDEQLLTYQESLQGDQMVRRWSGSTTPGAVSDKNAANLAFSLPGLRISTFPDFEAIASAYYARAKEKAVVTPEIQTLADEITKDKRDTKEQARALYDWVTHNIRYVAVYFGSGRFVPNDTATILSRRFGDCKDAATLLSALLAAKGIASEQVLINTLSTYRLAKTATLSAFNHVIVYIPALDRYVDPTVPFGNFDRLPMADSGKPVVRVSDKGVTVARTPVWSVNDNVIEIDARMSTAANGLRSGRTTITSRGMFADLMRAYLAQIEARGQGAGASGARPVARHSRRDRRPRGAAMDRCARAVQDHREVEPAQAGRRQRIAVQDAAGHEPVHPGAGAVLRRPGDGQAGFCGELPGRPRRLHAACAAAGQRRHGEAAAGDQEKHAAVLLLRRVDARGPGSPPAHGGRLDRQGPRLQSRAGRCGANGVRQHRHARLPVGDLEPRRRGCGAAERAAAAVRHPDGRKRAETERRGAGGECGPPQPAGQVSRTSSVGWVERSETHRRNRPRTTS